MPDRKAVASALLAVVALMDPFAFFRPTVRVRPADRTALASGNAFARTVSAPAGSVAIVAAVPVRIDATRLVAWMHDIPALKKSPMVRQIGRFSATPSVNDVQGLTLDDEDVAEVARCRLDDCGVKLQPSEIERIRVAIGEDPAHPSAAVQHAFREVVVARAAAYVQNGRRQSEAPAFLATNWPALDGELRKYPRVAPGAESFLYWSKEAYGGKPIISVTHVTMVRGARPEEPAVLVIGQQVMSTHYTDHAWSFTALVKDDAATYLVYLNQTEIDVLDTWYGGLVRRIVERRLREEAVDVLNGLRRRLESGDPPDRSGE